LHTFEIGGGNASIFWDLYVAGDAGHRCRRRAPVHVHQFPDFLAGLAGKLAPLPNAVD